jgi:arsenate reductase
MRVLFVCVGNSGRSVMAERLFRQAAGGSHQARSAGSAPAEKPEPAVLAALAEIGIDASDHVPAKLDDERIAWADVVVATCDDACPVVPGKRYVSWRLRDPKGRPLAEVRAIRDEVAERVGALLRSEDDEHDRGDAEDRPGREEHGGPA